MLSTLSGSFMLFIPLQFLNTKSPSVFTLPPIVTEESESQLSNALLPTEVTESGIVTEEKLSAPQNALSPIVCIVEGRVIFDISSRSTKPPAPMPVMVIESMLSGIFTSVFLTVADTAVSEFFFAKFFANISCDTVFTSTS